jgi:hypothetical protein
LLVDPVGDLGVGQLLDLVGQRVWKKGNERDTEQVTISHLLGSDERLQSLPVRRANEVWVNATVGRKLSVLGMGEVSHGGEISVEWTLIVFRGDHYARESNYSVGSVQDQGQHHS